MTQLPPIGPLLGQEKVRVVATLGADQSVVRVDRGLDAVPGVESARLA